MRYVLTAALILLLSFPSPTFAEDVLDVWLDKLRAVECDAPKCEDRFRITDTNGYYSYGILQFQKATFEEQALKYGILYKYKNPDALEMQAYQEELDELVYDSATQLKLARLMFENDPHAWQHWRNSILGMWVNGTFKPGIGCPPTPNFCSLRVIHF